MSSFNVGFVIFSNLTLRSCADVQNASQLNAVFKQISEKPGEPARTPVR
jgi:hypothetical protein